MDKIKKLFGFIDLTEGKPYKVLLIFALPLLLSNILTSSLNFINAMVLKSTVGGVSVTAINQTGSLNSILLQFGFGCASGFSVIIGQKLGAKNEDGVKKAYFNSIYLSLIISILVLIIGVISLPSLLELLNVNEIFLDRSYKYFLIILIGYPITLLNVMLSNVIGSLGNSFVPLLISASTTSFHILVVYLLTSQSIANLDVVGCGVATIFTNFLSLIIQYIYLIKTHPELKFKLNVLKFDKEYVLDLIKLGVPLGFQWSILFIGSFVQNSQVNKYGEYASMGMTCYSQFEGYITMPISVMSTALLRFVGQNYGANKRKRIKEGIKDAFLIDVIFYVLILIVGFAIAKYVPYIFLNEEEVNERVIFYTSIYIYILVPSLILQAIITISRSSLQGIKKPLIPFISGIGELVARIVISLCMPLIIDPNYESTLSDASYIGLCFSNMSAWVVASLVMGISVICYIFLNKNFLKEDESYLIKSEENNEQESDI